jgi:DNA-binding transcriptional ArsR family regulator
MSTEHVFKALADHHRRRLLDLLAQHDGQTLTDLCTQFPMTRIGVMKHLRILEEAGLITTHKVGREKLHYLNQAPIQAIADWVDQVRRLRETSFDRLEELLRAQPPHENSLSPESGEHKGEPHDRQQL